MGFKLPGFSGFKKKEDPWEGMNWKERTEFRKHQRGLEKRGVAGYGKDNQQFDINDRPSIITRVKNLFKG